MRISSSLLLILAAITMANAAVVDTAVPIAQKHHLARVKDGKASVNALDTAKVATSHVDLKNLKHLVKVAARRGLANVDAAHAAHVNIDAIDMKHVAGLIHTLSAHLESQTKTADGILKLKDHKKQAIETDALLENIKASLADTFINLHHLTHETKKATSHKGAIAKVGLLSRDVLQALNLNTVSSLISSKDIAGSAGLTTLLSNLKADSVLQGDAMSVLTNVQLIETIHKVAKIDTVLASIMSIPDAVPLIQAFQGLDSPVAFVSALADVKSITKLVSAVQGGKDEVAKVPGSEKLVAYAGKYGFNTVARVFNVAGVEGVLNSVVAVPGSVALLESIKSVADVPAFVSGLHVLNVVSFVKSIQSVSDVTALTGVLSHIHKASLNKRELLDGVKGTVAGLDLQRVLSLKRAIAHVVALPDSTLAQLDAAAKRSVTSGLVDSDVAGLDLAQVAVLKRSIADLSVLSEKEVDALSAAMKRDVLGNIDSLVDTKNVLSAVNLDSVTGLVGGIAKRDVLGNVESLVDLESVTGLVGGVAKRDVLGNVDSLVDTKNVLSAVDLDSVTGLVGGVAKRDVLENVDSLVDLSSITGLVGLNRLTDDTVKRDGLPVGKLPLDVGGFGSGPLGAGGAVLSLLDPNGGLAGISGAGDGTLGHGGGDLTFLDVHRLASVKRSSLLSPVEGTVSNLQLLQTLPVLKRAILAADDMVSSLPTSELLHSVHPLRRHAQKEDAVAVSLFDGSVDTFATDLTAVLTRVGKITDALHVDALTSDVKEQVIPLMQAVTKSVADIASVKAPGVSSKLDKVHNFAAKTAKSLP